MKTNELAKMIITAAEWLKPTQTRELLEIAHELENASARKLKKNNEAFIVRLERVSRPSVRFVPVFEWVRCDDCGRPWTPTGRMMTAKHSVLGYR